MIELCCILVLGLFTGIPAAFNYSTPCDCSIRMTAILKCLKSAVPPTSASCAIKTHEKVDVTDVLFANFHP